MQKMEVKAKMKTEMKTEVKTHRVGSITFGGMLVTFGILFLIRIFIPLISYEVLFRLWPIMLISLGIEVLLGNMRSSKVSFVYDGWAIFLTCIMVFFAGVMCFWDCVINYYQTFSQSQILSGIWNSAVRVVTYLVPIIID